MSNGRRSVHHRTLWPPPPGPLPLPAPAPAPARGRRRPVPPPARRGPAHPARRRQTHRLAPGPPSAPSTRRPHPRSRSILVPPAPAALEAAEPVPSSAPASAHEFHVYRQGKPRRQPLRTRELTPGTRGQLGRELQSIPAKRRCGAPALRGEASPSRGSQPAAPRAVAAPSVAARPRHQVSPAALAPFTPRGPPRRSRRRVPPTRAAYLHWSLPPLPSPHPAPRAATRTPHRLSTGSEGVPPAGSEPAPPRKRRGPTWEVVDT